MIRQVALWALVGLAGLSPLQAAPAPFAFQDDFAGYPAASDGAPRWLAYSPGWSVQGGAYRCDYPGHTFALLEGAPLGRTVNVEASLRITGTRSPDWKIAGLAVFADGRNYWHLALVQAPDKEGGRHFVELSEMMEGAWLAHQGKLTAAATFEAPGSWQAGLPYRLRLEMSPQGIRGEVAGQDGQVIARLGFLFDGQAVTWGRPALTSSGFAAEFDDAAAAVADPVPAPAPLYPAYYGPEGRPPLPGAPGFFRVVRRAGRWWLLDPNGREFWARGTDHANWQVHWCEQLGYAPYHRNLVAKYGEDEARWARLTRRRLQSWGFNMLGVNSSPSLRHAGLGHLELLGIGQSFAAGEHIVEQVHWTGFPDVFSPRWSTHCDRLARLMCAPQRDDPWLVGYFLDNELEWFGKSWQPGGMVHDLWLLPPESPAKQAFLALLRCRYGTVQHFNRAWGTNFPDFAALARHREPVRVSTPDSQRDSQQFVRMAAERYFQVAAAAIRRYDPHHLILGCRFAGTAPQIWDLAGRCCDVVSVNCYRTVDLESGQVIDFAQDLARWHRESGRPLMITEWSFPALDSGLPCQHGAGQRFATQGQRAQAFAIFQELLLRTPFVVGSNYFMWADEPALGISSTFPEDSNYGLVNEQDRPYPELTHTAARLHAQWRRLHQEGALPPPSPAPPPAYRAGAPWAGPGGQRLPLLVWAPRYPGREVTVAARLADLWPGEDPRRVAAQAALLLDQTAGASPCPFQVDDLELVFRTRLDGPRTLYLYLCREQARQPQPVGWLRREGSRLLAESGPLALLKEEGSPAIFDQISYQGTPLGKLLPLLWQRDGGDHWDLDHQVQVAALRQGPLRASIDFLVTNRGELPYRAGWRVCLYPDRGWFGSRCLWIENTAAQAWTVHAYYHYTQSAIGGEGRDEAAAPQVPGYYLPFAAWVDDKLGLALGVLSPRLGDFSPYYWRDEGGGQHSDFARYLDVVLRPGQRYQQPQPEAVIFAAAGQVLEAAEALHQELRAGQLVQWRGQARQQR